MSNPSYPYNFPGNATKYYSNVNHNSVALRGLSEVYKITGDQRYLDRAIQIAEEIIAWQDYQDARDPWGETLAPDGSWDGSWYWYDYSATSPLPDGCVSPPGGGFSAARKIVYHIITLRGLVKLLDVTKQHILPGTTTIRNNISFTAFRSNLIGSVIKAVNFIIENQEIISNPQTYRGLIKSFKNDKSYGSDYILDYTNDGSAPWGLSIIIDAYTSLLKSNALSSTDETRLASLVNSLSTNMIGKYSASFIWDRDGELAAMMENWSKYLYFKSQTSIDNSLNLVNNSFEDKVINWELWSWDGGGVTVSKTEHRTGSNSIHIVDGATNASKWASLLVDVDANTSYTASAYAHILSGRQLIYIHYYDDN